MAKFRFPQNSFSFGEVSRRMVGRVDLDQYRQGCRTLKNMLPHPEGGAYKRSGTLLWDTDSDFNSQTFMRLRPLNGVSLVFWPNSGVSYNRFDFGQYTAFGIYADAASTAVVGPYQGTTLDDYVGFSGWAGTALLQSAKFFEFNDFLFSCGKDDPPFGIYDNGTNYQIIPYYAFDLTQAHAEIAFNIPYTEINTTAITMLSSGTAGSVTITLSSATGLPGYIPSGFGATPHVGTVIQCKHTGSATRVFARITAVSSTTSATATVIHTDSIAIANVDWRIQAWNNVLGWPRAMVVHENRMLYFGSNYFPNRIWASQIGDISDLYHRGATIAASDAQFGDMAWSDQEFQWALSSPRGLLVGTSKGEYLINPASNESSFNFVAGNFRIIPQSFHGSVYLEPVVVDNRVLFVSRDGFTLRDLGYSFQSDGLVSRDLSLQASHFARRDAFGITQNFLDGSNQLGKITTIEYDQRRQTVWVTNEFGALFSYSLNATYGVSAWARHEVGGPVTNTEETVDIDNSAGQATEDVDNPPMVVSASIVYNDNFPERTDPVFVVNRTINGSVGTYVEKLAQNFNLTEYLPGNDAIRSKISDDAGNSGVPPLAEIYLPMFLDMSTYLVAPGSDYGEALTDWTRLTDYANETVDVFTDAGYIGQVAVDGSGEFTLAVATKFILVGFLYTAELEPLPPQVGAIAGTALGAIKRIDQAVIKFYETNYAKVDVGSLNNQPEEISFRDEDDDLSELPVLFTGDKKVETDLDYAYDNTIKVVSDLPYPMTILSISFEGQTSD